MIEKLVGKEVKVENFWEFGSARTVALFVTSVKCNSRSSYEVTTITNG